MNRESVVDLIHCLERAYPEATYPDVAISIGRMRRAYDSELRIKQLCEFVGIKLPRSYVGLPPLLQRSEAWPK